MIIPRGFNPGKSCIQFDVVRGLQNGFLGPIGMIFGNSLRKSSDKAEQKQEDAMNAANAKADAATANTPQVSDTSNKDSAASRIGRAALISTSPLGVQTTDPTGRRKLLGNTY